jgi:cytochrome c-type biogenesis protein CcmE
MTDGEFVAEEILAKHDENYMPPEVAEALQKAREAQGE